MNTSSRGLEESVIRQMTRIANKAGAVNLSQGFPDFGPPYELRAAIALATLGGDDAGIEKLLRTPLAELVGSDVDFSRLTVEQVLRLADRKIPPHDVYNQYSTPQGMLELRNAISKKAWEYNGIASDPEKNIIITCGATEALFSTLGALIRQDGRKEVIVFQPFHEMYPNQLGFVGGNARYATLKEPDWNSAEPQWQMYREELKTLFSDRTAAIIFNTPHNPTGLVFSREDLQFIAGLCIEHDALAITDEIYEHMTYDGHAHLSIASLEGMAGRTITCSAISKTYAATGLRVGWVIAPEEIAKGIKAVHDTVVIQAPTLIQKALQMALDSEEFRLKDDYYRELREKYAERRNTLIEGLRAAGFRCAVPQGAYYLFADYSAIRPDLTPMEFALLLTERAKVTPVPGNIFYAGPGLGNSYVRFAFAKDISTLQQAVVQLKAADLG